MAGNTSSSVYSRFCLSFVLVISLAWLSLGCFPVFNVFELSCLWTQTTSMQSHYRISVCPEHRGHERGAPITIRPEGIVTDFEEERTLECLRAYRDHRYLIKVSQSHSRRVLGYQCIKFSPLTAKVVRQEKTSGLVSDIDELSCEGAIYVADEAVLIASFTYLQPKPCPLTGGFQLVMSLGESVSNSQECQRSISTYKPQIQFQCDHNGSPNALIDLGKACTPKVVWDSYVLRGRYVAHLHCLDTWQENKGASEFMSVLLGMRDSPKTYWCLHVKLLGKLVDRASAPLKETLYQSLLTFDGRCVGNIDNRDVLKDASMFGKLVSFVPNSSTKCQDSNYLKECRGDGGEKCTESLDCPASCGRCKDTLKLQDCSFPVDMRGSWESFSYDKKPTFVVEKSSVQSPNFGEFHCRGPKEFGERKGLYALVQSGVESTCMPYYSCTQMISLAPGLLSFQMRPALRDIYSGNLYSCQETHTQVGIYRPETAERTVTMLQKTKLRGVSCNIQDLAYPTIAVKSQCQFLIHECDGPCQVFNISLDVETCQNMSAANFGIYTHHACMAKISFDDGDQAILTNVPNSNTYFCWLFRDSRLFVLKADACNQNRINDIFEYEDDIYLLYDPVYQLVESKSDSSGRGVQTAQSVIVVEIGLLATWLMVTKNS